ncbi:hypothetical protein KPL78_19265 [Roseomonas sp. HJA6]|uniref:DUF3426 domain-containing protein n=1 Tax=Roseomonas alba TaxID=2846776 RepID=A0ABS7AFR3_9PROT|nr:hypothetical protein [Neoroseomonas alba]MBW6400009.1 hypothetical protein [Neoroseomonas alba]
MSGCEGGGMRAMLVAVVLGLLGVAAQAQQPADPQPPAWWPSAGKLGITGMVQSRAGGCRMSFLVLNNTRQDFRDISVTLIVEARNQPGIVTDVTFRFADAGGAREAQGWINGTCPRNPRVEMREARCSTGPLAFQDCLSLFQPVEPPARQGRELVRLRVVEPR